MRTSLARLGLGFGNLGVTVRGTTKYHISPLEQKAFAGAFSQGMYFVSICFVRWLTYFFLGLPNTLWRIRKSVFIVLPPFIMSYLIFTETEKEHERLQRKQPGQFDHES